MKTVPIRPTPEQKAILKSRGRSVRINARAGTGKTTTLQLLAAQNRQSRILYLVFNRRAKEQAERILPENVEVATIHSFAFTRSIRRRRFSVDQNFTSAAFLPAFRSDSHALASLSYEFTAFFLNSVFERLEEAAAAFYPLLSGERAELFKKRKKHVVRAVRTLATGWQSGSLACPHDFYLKMFHKSGHFLSALNAYDIILVDEGQDLTEVVLDVLSKTGRRLYLVGDTHQQIYGFRFAVDAMRKLPCEEEYELSTSFRFGAPIADLASLFIRGGKGEQGFTVRGSTAVDSRVITYEGTPRPWDRSAAAVLSRTNLAMFQNAIALSTAGVPYRFERGIGNLIGKTFDVYWLSQEYRDGVRDPFIRSFPSMKDLDAYAEEMEDSELKSLSRIVSRHGKRFPGALYDILERQKADEGLILSTVHAAKGQEYAEVHVDEDIGEAIKSAGDTDGILAEEEYNIAYVAFTRAKSVLFLPENLKSAAGPEWEKAFSGLPDRVRAAIQEARRRSAGAAPSVQEVAAVRKRREAAGPKRREASGAVRRNEQSAQKRLEPGDQVETTVGPGRIVRVEGDRFLIGFDDKKFQLWERRENLTRS